MKIKKALIFLLAVVTVSAVQLLVIHYPAPTLTVLGTLAFVSSFL
jgi:hypothetical protein